MKKKKKNKIYKWCTENCLIICKAFGSIKMINSTILWLLFTLQIAHCVQNYQKCNTSSWQNGCPKSTKCSEISESNAPYAGECHCIDENYEFNTNFKGDSDYCVYVEPKHFDNRVMASKSSSTSAAAVDNANSSPSSHHIVGGMLISICLVVLFVLLAVGVKKLQLKQRIRNLRMTQRNRPLYEDVMMANDNDDPPLI